MEPQYMTKGSPPGSDAAPEVAYTQKPQPSDAVCGPSVFGKQRKPVRSEQSSAAAGIACVQEQELIRHHFSQTDKIELGFPLTNKDEDQLAPARQPQQSGKFLNNVSVDRWHTRKPSNLLCIGNAGKSVAASTRERCLVRSTQDNGPRESVVFTEEGAHARRATVSYAEDLETRKVRRTGPLLLPPRDFSTDAAIRMNSSCGTLEGGETRVSNDSFCSPTAFSVAATAASLTCSSPPSCSSLEERNSLGKNNAESEPVEQAEELQRQRLVLVFPRSQGTPPTKALQRPVTLSLDTKILNKQQLQQHLKEHRREPVKIEQPQEQRAQWKQASEHSEPQPVNSSKTLHCQTDQLEQNLPPRESTEENTGGDANKQEGAAGASYFYAGADSSTKRPALRKTSEHLSLAPTAGLHSLETANRNYSPSSAAGWAPSRPLQMLQSRENSGGVTGNVSLFACPSACEEDQSVATHTGETTVHLRVPKFAVSRKSTTTTTRSSRNSMLEWGDVVDAGRPSSSRMSTEAELRCFQPSPPDCCFCSCNTCTRKLAFPPPPARLLTRFIAYVFAPQVQRLQRRLHQELDEPAWRNVLFRDSSYKERVVGKITVNSTYAAPASPTVVKEDSQAREPQRRGTATATYVLQRNSWPAGEPTAFSKSTVHEKQAQMSKIVQTSGVWNGCPSYWGVDQRKGNPLMRPTIESGFTQRESENFKQRASATEQSSSASITLHNHTAEVSPSKCTGLSPTPEKGNHRVGRAPPATSIAAALQERTQSVLMALQLKQHLLSLVFYMERLLKRIRFGCLDSSPLSMPPAQLLVPQWEEWPPSIQLPYEDQVLIGKDYMNNSHSFVPDSSDFAFHIQQLLRAEIKLQPVLHTVSQAEQHTEVPPVSGKPVRYVQGGAAERKHFGRASGEGCNANKPSKPHAATSHMPQCNVPYEGTAYQRTGSIGKDEEPRSLLTEALKCRAHMTEAAKLVNGGDTSALGKSDLRNEKNNSSSCEREHVAIASLVAGVPAQQPTGGIASRPLSPIYGLPFNVALREEVVIGTAEDIVLLGVPPAVMNYLVVFSPLLVLQAVQQLEDDSTDEESATCSGSSLGDRRHAVGESSHEEGPPDSELKSNYTSQTRGDEVAGEPLQLISQTATRYSDVACASPLNASTYGLYAAGAEDTARGKHLCPFLPQAGMRACEEREYGEDFENSLMERTPECTMDSPAVEAQAAGIEATCREVTTATSENICAGEKRQAEAPEASEGAAATNTGKMATYERAKFSSHALQTELTSALYWVNRGLAALSPLRTLPSVSAESPNVSLGNGSHKSGPSPWRHSAPGTNENASNKVVTPESLTAAVLLLAKAVERSQGGQTKIADCSFFLDTYDDSCITNDALSAPLQQLVTSVDADCSPVHASKHGSQFHSVSSSRPALDFAAGKLVHVDDYSTELTQERLSNELKQGKPSGELQAKEKNGLCEEGDRSAGVKKTQDRGACDVLPATERESQFSPPERFATTSLVPATVCEDTELPFAPEEGLKIEAMKRNAEIFFAPLYYPQQIRYPYSLERNEELHREQRLLRQNLPARGASARHADRSSASVAASKFEQRIAMAEKTAEHDLVERLVLQILAQLDASVSFHVEDAIDAKLASKSKQGCYGRDREQSKTGERCVPHVNRHADGQPNPATPDECLHHLAQLLGETEDIGAKATSEKLCARIDESRRTLQSMSGGGCDANLCKSSATSPRTVSWNDVLEKSAVAQPAHRRKSVGCEMQDDERGSEGKSFVQSTEKEWPRESGDFLVQGLNETDLISFLKCSEISEHSRTFNNGEKSEDQTAGDVAAQGYKSISGDRKPTGLRNPVVRQRSKLSELEKDLPCDNSDAAISSTKDTSDRAAQNAAALEGAAASALDRAHSCHDLLGNQNLLQEESPDKLNRLSAVPNYISSPTRAGVRGSPRAAENSGEPSARMEYKPACETCKASAFTPKTVQPQDQVQPGTNQGTQFQRNYPQQWTTEHEWVEREAGVQRDSAWAASVKSDSSLYASVIPGVQQGTGNRRRNAAHEADCRRREAAEGRNSTQQNESVYAERRVEKSVDEGERSGEEDEQPGKICSTWQRHQWRWQSMPTGDTVREEMEEKDEEHYKGGLEQRTLHSKSRTNKQSDRSAEKRRNSARRYESGIALCSLNGDAPSPGETISTRRAFVNYNDNGEQKESWSATGQRGSLEPVGRTDDKVDVDMDTRRPMRGVYFDRTQRSWIGSFYEDRRQIKKRFKVDIYGFLKAKALAVDVRLGYERRMRAGVVGAGAAGAAAAAGGAAYGPRGAAAATNSVCAAASRLDPGGSSDAEKTKETDRLSTGEREAGRWIKSLNSAPTQLQDRRKRMPEGVMEDRNTHIGDDCSSGLSQSTTVLRSLAHNVARGSSPEKRPGNFPKEVPETVASARLAKNSSEEVDKGANDSSSQCCAYDFSTAFTSQDFSGSCDWPDIAAKSETTAPSGMSTREPRLQEKLAAKSKRDGVKTTPSRYASDLERCYGDQSRVSDVDRQAPKAHAPKMSSPRSGDKFLAMPSAASGALREDLGDNLASTGTQNAAQSGSKLPVDLGCEQEGQQSHSHEQADASTDQKILQVTAPRRAARASSQNEKQQSSCTNLTREDTLSLSAQPSLHHVSATTQAFSSLKREKAVLSDSAQGGLWQSCITAEYALKEGIRKRSPSKEKRDDRNAAVEGTTNNLASAAATFNSAPRGQGRALYAQDADEDESSTTVTRGNGQVQTVHKIPHADNAEHKDGPLAAAFVEEAQSSHVEATTVRRRFSSPASAAEYSRTAPSTKSPADVVTVYMLSKRRKRPLDALHEGGRSAAPIFGHGLPLGVFYTSKKHAYCANWYEGKRQLKRYFPICKLGEQEARRLAIAARRDAERREREARCRPTRNSFAYACSTGRNVSTDSTCTKHDPPSDSARIEQAFSPCCTVEAADLKPETSALLVSTASRSSNTNAELPPFSLHGAKGSIGDGAAKVCFSSPQRHQDTHSRVRKDLGQRIILPRGKCKPARKKVFCLSIKNQPQKRPGHQQPPQLQRRIRRPLAVEQESCSDANHIKKKPETHFPERANQIHPATANNAELKARDQETQHDAGGCAKICGGPVENEASVEKTRGTEQSITGSRQKDSAKHRSCCIIKASVPLCTRGLDEAGGGATYKKSDKFELTSKVEVPNKECVTATFRMHGARPQTRSASPTSAQCVSGDTGEVGDEGRNEDAWEGRGRAGLGHNPSPVQYDKHASFFRLTLPLDPAPPATFLLPAAAPREGCPIYKEHTHSEEETL